MISRGDVAVAGVRPGELLEPLKTMERMGAAVSVREKEKEIRVQMKKRPSPVFLETGPYPQFPTDLQPVFLAAACTCRGESRIRETVFEARFAAADEMKRFGARIRTDRDTVHVKGRWPLGSASVRAPDLRGGAALVLAGMAAEGISRIEDCGHIERGYEDLCRDLSLLGAKIWMERESLAGS